jgi:GTP-binding protein
MLPAVALVGRPNVGKSTLFNRLTATRDALVADFPGLTRDRRYGVGLAAERKFIVIDTGGLTAGDSTAITALVAEQVAIAIEEADAIVLVVDHKSGVTADDLGVAERLRRAAKPVIIAVNKSEGVPSEIAEAEFHRIGLGAPVGISAGSISGRWRRRRRRRAGAEGRRHRPTECRQVNSDQSFARREPPDHVARARHDAG